MLFKTVCFSLIATLGLVSAQSLPACAETCYISNYGKAEGCSQTDISCLCKSTAFQGAVGACFAANCSAADASTGVAFGASSCAAVGITVTTSALTATGTGAATNGTSANATTSAPTTSGSATGTASSPPASTTTTKGAAPGLLTMGQVSGAIGAALAVGIAGLVI
ncbi:hypothetical protein T439DRAFT_380402 [Meredithblackwellia eburnea MCA 4105]